MHTHQFFSYACSEFGLTISKKNTQVMLQDNIKRPIL
jgi:hypothetical protein